MEKPSYPIAWLFYKQCCGEVIGDGGSRPANQNIADILEAHEVSKDPKELAKFLRAIADQLDPEGA